MYLLMDYSLMILTGDSTQIMQKKSFYPACANSRQSALSLNDFVVMARCSKLVIALLVT